MPKPINSYILSNSIIDRMKEALIHTKRAKREFGFSLCTSDKEIHDEFHCVGTQCKIQPTRKCMQGKFLGDFHTHPKAMAELSISDMFFAYRDGIGCIGGVKDNKIRCFTRKGEMDIKDLKIIHYEIPKSEGERAVSQKRFREYEYVRGNLQKNLFNTFDIV